MRLIKNMIMFSSLNCFIAGTVCAIFTSYEILNGFDPVLSLSFMLVFYILFFMHIIALYNTNK